MMERPNRRHFASVSQVSFLFARHGRQPYASFVAFPKGPQVLEGNLWRTRGKLDRGIHAYGKGTSGAGMPSSRRESRTIPRLAFVEQQSRRTAWNEGSYRDAIFVTTNPSRILHPNRIMGRPLAGSVGPICPLMLPFLETFVNSARCDE